MGGGYDDAGKLVFGRQPLPEEFGEAWDFNFDEVYFAGKGRQAFLKPDGERPAWGMNWDEDQGAGEYPNAYFFYLPRICNHCSNPACLEACPHGAIYKRKIDGLVLRDETRCQGEQDCMCACPYKKIYFNAERRIAQHCIGCFPRLEKGVAPPSSSGKIGRSIREKGASPWTTWHRFSAPTYAAFSANSRKKSQGTGAASLPSSWTR
jgi:NAD-dependent dihydropyrimidine dehydrogenase PreA subunit